MKRIFPLIILAALCYSSGAQNTWVQKLSYNYQTWGYDDTLTGVMQVQSGPDSSLYILAYVDPHGGQNVYKFSPNSHQIEWYVYAGHVGSQIVEWTDRFRATPDSGIITCYNVYDEQSYSGWSFLNKYSKSGTLQWSHQFGSYLAPYNHTLYDVVEKSSGGFYALVEDSIYLIDNAGNGVDSSSAIAGRKLLQMSNGDLLVLTASNQLIRADTAGTIFWSHPCSGEFDYDTSSVFIHNSNSFIQKVDAISGVQIWNNNYGLSPISGIESTHDGGFIASVGYKPLAPYGFGGASMSGKLFRVNSLGDTVWTRSYPLPHFGLSAIKIMPGGNICTGGCYFSGYAMMGVSPNEYSAFCCMMNADGSYPLSQTSYVGPKDANNDHISDFVEDGLEVMLGLGQTGPARDITVEGYPYPCERDDIAIDWLSYTNSGVNRKYSDFDGNGIIDTNDIQLCDWDGWIDSFPSYYRQVNPNKLQSVEEFCLIPVRDTVALGDPILYYMVMGSNANPVDSIYGFAFTYNVDSFGNDYADSVFSITTGLGTIGLDLFQNHRFLVSMNMGNEWRSRTLICRTNFQNAYNINDTIGIVRFLVLPFDTVITPTIRRFKAILVSGTEIPFNVCTGSVYIDSSTVSTYENQFSDLVIFPNPASDFISVRNLFAGTKKITVLNSLGMTVKEFESTEKQLQIGIADLPNGIYTLLIQTQSTVNKSLFVVRH